ncbi:MAG: hypothetical protein GX639_20965 [Fibrobacter sp.]|nr:hypothetical protein [Fibrobacter sp.]
MYDQGVEPNVSLDDRPVRETVIEKDEIISLIIDIETMDSREFYKKYFV